VLPVIDAELALIVHFQSRQPIVRFEVAALQLYQSRRRYLLELLLRVSRFYIWLLIPR